MESLGQYIRRVRLSIGMTANELAQRLGVSGPYISTMERGKAEPISHSRLPDLAKVLGVELEELQAREAIERGRVPLSCSAGVWNRAKLLQEAA